MIFDIYSIYCLREIYSIYCLRENRKMHRQQTLWLLFDIALQVLNVLLSSVQTLCVSSSLSESRVKTRKYLVGQDIIQQNIFGWHFNWFNCLVLPHSSVIIPVWVTSHCMECDVCPGDKISWHQHHNLWFLLTNNLFWSLVTLGSFFVPYPLEHWII